MGPKPRPDLAELAGYHSPQVDVAVRLNTNESPYPPPPGFVADLAEVARRLVYHRYPDRTASGLRAALAAHVGVDASMLFCANGSNEVIQVLLLAFGGARRRALLFAPTYSMHVKIAEATGTPVVQVARDGAFEVGPDTVAAACEELDPDVVLFCSPNNPSGTLERRESVEAAAADGGRLVVVDEAYSEFCGETALDLALGRDNVVVVRTMSKAWSIPALRLGYLVAPPELIAALAPAHLPYHLNAFTQEAGRIALRYAPDMATRVDLVRAERDRVAVALDAMGGLTVWPSAANFLLFRVDAGRDAAAAAWRDLLARGVLVRDFSSLPHTEGCLRVTIGTPDENSAFLSALAAALDAEGT